MAGYIGKGKAQSLTDVPANITHDIAVDGSLTTTGNVGIGTSSPSFPLHINSGALNTALYLESTDPVVGIYFKDDTTTSNATLGILGQGDDFRFMTSGSEAMRINSSGNVGINTTPSTTIKLSVVNNGTNPTASFTSDTGTFYSTPNLRMTHMASTGTINGRNLEFKNNTGGTVGSITSNGTATAFNTSSDYRLKQNIQPVVNSIDRINALNPVNFEWISTGNRVDGFIAHELATVVPEAVTGEKDAMHTEEYVVTEAVPATYDEEGNELTPAVEAVMGTREVPDYQGIDQSKLVPLLTAALQEAIVRIETLESEVATLKGAV